MSTLAHGVTRKINRVTSLDIDSDNVRSALATLSFLESQAGYSKTSLKSFMEHGMLQSNNEFATKWGEFVSELQKGEYQLSGMESICNEVNGIVSDRQTTPSALISRTENLLDELNVADKKYEAIQCFKRDYQLEDSTAELIQAGDIDKKFFEALKSVHLVHENCRQLLHTHHQRAGLELLDLMASYEETAYERLCKWVQVQCRGLGDVEDSEVHPLLSSALNALKARPVLLRYCAEEVATARHSYVFKAFLVALTNGGPQGRPRPMEVHAHNPRRYVGDMLAWVLQAAASDNDLLLALYSADVPALPHSDQPFSINTSDLLDKVMAGVCAPLRLRVEQVLHSNSNILVTFQLFQLLQFYYTTIQKLLSRESQLLTTIAGLQDMALKNVKAQLRGLTDRLRRSPALPSADLLCPAPVLDIVSHISQLADALEGDLQQDPDEAAVDTFTELVSDTLTPLVEVCANLAGEMRQKADNPGDIFSHRCDPDVFMLNCLLALQSPLALHNACKSQAAHLQTKIDDQVTKIASEAARQILTNDCGAQESLAETLLGEVTDLATLDLPADQVKQIMLNMFEAASSPDMVPEFETISVPRVRVTVAHSLCEQLVNLYTRLHSSASDDIQHKCKHPSQMGTLLGLADESNKQV